MHRSVEVRRPVAAREAAWIRGGAHTLATLGVRPNHVSIASVGFAAIAGGCLVVSDQGSWAWRSGALLAAALCIQLRLLCNLLDGLLAIEGGLRTKSGVIFNELPDRFSDAIVIVCAGYAAGAIAWAPDLGWAVALLAVLTAYVRALGGASGAGEHFAGPMAKQQRMAVLTAACVLAPALATPFWHDGVLVLALFTIGAGSIVTIGRRTVRVIRTLEAS